MDAGALGGVIGVSVMVIITIGFCIYDKCSRKPTDQIVVTNPLLKKRASFKVKNLFSHVEI